VLRPRRVIAIARRDLVLELSGRRGLALPIVTTLLLGPLAGLRLGRDPGDAQAPPPAVRVSGDVPASLADAPGVTVVPAGGVELIDDGDALRVRGSDVPPALRRALDGPSPAVTVTVRSTPLVLPGRTLTLALVASSILTSAVSASIAGERGRKTLETLLASSATRHEIVIGKWAAWTGYGVLAASLASAGAIAAGRVDPGWWMLPLPLVPACTVALGLYLVRRAADLVGGATVSMRVLPAALGISGIAAWILGRTDPLLGAALPLGGALVAAGGTWAGPAPALIAAATTGLTTAWLLDRTARDLEQEGAPRERFGVWAFVQGSLFGAFAWNAPVLGPLLWAAAGNPVLTAELPAAAGPLAGALALIAWVATAWARRATDPPPSAATWAGGLAAFAVVAVGAWLALGASDVWSPAGAWAVDARARGAFGLNPDPLPLAMVVILGQELYLRGWLHSRAGALAATVATPLVLTPADPLGGLILGVSAALGVRLSGGALAPVVLARLLVAWAC
jgi:hypothetical protein